MRSGENVMEIIRATTTAQRAGAYYVRIQAMAVKHHISLEQEFDEHDTPDTRYIVAVDDVLPVATVRMFPSEHEAGAMQLGRIVVLPEYRGRGLGRRVVEEAERWAREMGYTKTFLESRENKTSFYEKLGYTGDPGKVIQRDPFRCVYMEKELDGEKR